ncbi:MAG: hypothetical protein LBS72_08820 [Oscillospiraceae bacterium]|jgi:hypothetical protein|nr:hypothetical protein [Oscillospiraceae bacterium]
MNKQTIRDSIDTGLSGMEFTRRSQQAVLDRIKGGKPVKKKLSLALVFAIILALAAASALAATLWHNYYDTIGEKEYTEGYFESWSAADKAALVDTLIEADVPLDAEKSAKLHEDGLSDAERNALADEIIYGYYGEGRQGALTLIDMIAKEQGLLEFWPLELQAMYSDLQKRYMPNYKPWYGGSILPGDGDFTEDEAIQLARNVIKEDYNVDDQTLDAATISVAFAEHGDESSADGSPFIKRWVIEFYTKVPEPGIAGVGYAVVMRGDGTIEHTEEPMPPRQATSLTGMLMDWNIVSRQGYENAERYGASVNLDHVPNVNLWSAEGLALFAKDWVPRIKAAIANGEGMTEYYSKMAEIPYAMPTEMDISSAEAMSIAQAAARSQLSWTDEQFSIYSTSISYRIYNADAPIWRIAYFFRAEKLPTGGGTLQNKMIDGELPCGAAVRVDARSGKVISTEQWDRYFKFNWVGEFDESDFPIEEQKSNE